ncbi:MAG: ABC transporter substrate-binding protein [Aliarcobacter sp.]|nr:ABC transporter substrate-binding protein [Aliarcobacter sp.]MBP7226191.1 ABC transporter substrate-binding protein [Aliarcobacter sp.]
MFIKKLLITYLLLLLSLHASESNQKVTLYLDWLNQFQFAGYYMAKENGYYNDLDLDVNIIEYSKDANNDITQKVIKDEAVYGIGKSSLIIDKFAGNDIILLSSIFQNSPMALISLSSSNIKTPKDLINKKIMITNDAKESVSIKSLLMSEGVNFQDLNTQNFSSNEINDLINGNIDAITCYLSNEPFILKQKNIDFNIIHPNNYNFDFYEGILFTSQKELKNNPIRAQNFNQASIKGWEYAFNNIEKTAKIIYEKYNTQNKSLELLIFEGEVLKKLSKIDENLLGNINPRTIDEIKRIYSLLNLKSTHISFETESIILNKTHTLLNENDLNYLNANQFTLLTQADHIPFSFKNLNELIGIEIDFWKLISDKLSKPFNIEEVLKDNILNIFSNSIKVKFVYSFKKESSDKNVLSNPIAKVPLALATKNGVHYISDLNSVEHIKIGVLKDLEIFESLKRDYPNVNFIEINTIDDGIYRLKNNLLFGLIDNLYTLSHQIEQFQIDELKINTTLKYKINIYLEVKKQNEQFIKIVNKIIDSLSEKEKSSIFNNYQLILYHNNIDIYYILKFVIPLIILLSVFIFLNYRLRNEIKKREETEIKLSNLANNDSLTGIYNRRKIEELCEAELKRSERYSNELSVIFFDVNDFKIINDKLGHHKGDEVLIKIASVISQNIRTTDYFGRWGGDEFLIVLPQTNLYKTEHLVKILENILTTINFDLKMNRKISCSFGLSQYEKNDTLDSFLKRADESMYVNKYNYRQSKLQQL